MKNKIVDMDGLRKYKKEHNFFETPKAIAIKMADLLEAVGRDSRVLEPSIGMGALAKALEESTPYPIQIDYCEMQEDFIPHLSKYNRVGADFAELKATSLYDAVIMNPPYKNNLAQKHIDHAWNCTKPGGRIVALVSAGAVGYLDEEYMGHVFHKEEIKKGFKETSIDTFLYLIIKPLY